MTITDRCTYISFCSFVDELISTGAKESEALFRGAKLFAGQVGFDEAKRYIYLYIFKEFKEILTLN